MNEVARGGVHYPLASGAFLRREDLGKAPTTKATIDPDALDRPVSVLRGVGTTTEGRLRGLGVETVGDLLLHLPFRHESPSRLARVGDLRLGEEVTLRATVATCCVRETARRRVKVLEALVSDDSGSVLAVWYNQAYLEAPFQERPEVLLKGSLVRQRGRLLFVVKRHEILSEKGESRHILGLIPVYPSTADLSVRTIRTALHAAAPMARHLVDPLPSRLRAERRYAGRADAVLASHFPSSPQEAARARDRLAFEELLLLQIAVLRRRQAQDSSRRALPLRPPGDLCRAFLDALPYEPTGAQLRVIAEMDSDLAGSVPMRRLLHGDVGSGKTMVAAYGLLRAVEECGQGALMAPTEVLADQHYLGLSGQLSRHGVRVGLVKGSQRGSERRAILQALEAGEMDVVVGTHALIEDRVRFHDLRLAVVDEQHRFGVRQREAIRAAAGPGGGETWPHVLHMSATPIPRTLSLTVYGDLDLSVLDEMPPGRHPVRTRLVPRESVHRMWEAVRADLRRGRQAYVVCPLIEESEALDVASAKRMYEVLGVGELQGFRLRLLHGQLPSAEKAAAMAAFVAGEVDVLVSTSVIEVGVDVANAAVMVIVGAQRFGLSQLHQLRGRVGRGTEMSSCFLLPDGEDEGMLDRLRLFARTSDGFALAEADLAARGEGQLFGDRQSGLGDLEVASLVRDKRLLEDARAVAKRMMGKKDVGLDSPLLEEFAELRFGSRLSWMERA